jgi:proteasome lid subunit RPN8/RPN11
MKFSENIKKSIKIHSKEEFPKECCGLIVSRNKEDQIFKCRNTSESPKNHFSLHPVDYLRGSESGAIKAVYHSHPSDNDKFSPCDILNSKKHSLLYVLYNVKKDVFSTFDPKKDKTFLYDRIFRIGESDCYTFVKEYYADLGIKLHGYNNLGDNWHKKNPNLIQDLFELNEKDKNLNISELSPSSEFRKHDVLVFEFLKGSGANHVAVYLGNGQIMHHPRNKYLCTEPLSTVYKNKIIKVYRHDKFS